MPKVVNQLLTNHNYAKTAKMMAKKFNKHVPDFQFQEWIYRSKLIAFLHGCGVRTIAELQSNLGCSDIVIFYGGKTYVIELKVARKDKGHVPVKRAEEALRQIEQKNYAA